MRVRISDVFLASNLLFLGGCIENLVKKDETDTDGSAVVDEDGDGRVTDRDCDEGNPDVYEGAPETCDGVDNDCDGNVDENPEDAVTWWADEDGDGYGSGDPETDCEPPAGAATVDGDCDDTDAEVNPDASERCNGVDDDCNGRTDDGVEEVRYWPDDDGDGFGDASAPAEEGCDMPSGYVTNNDDCDDGNRAIHPDADEYCNGWDDDCDGAVDGSDALDADYYFEDADGDGFGDPATYDLMCDGADNGLDCDDRDASEPQVADASSTAASPDGTLARPWPTIQEAIAAANECVLAVAGTYTENVNFLGKDLLVQSIEGAATTIIDGSGGGPVVTFSAGESAGAELRGFTLANGGGFFEETISSRSCGSSSTCYDYYRTWCGGGIYVDGATPTLQDLTVIASDLTAPPDSSSGNNYYYNYTFGGGICVRNAALSISGVDVWQNHADDGGGIYVEAGASLDFEQGGIVANTASSGAGLEVDGGTVSLTNVLLAWNVAAENGGGIFAVDATLGLTNVTVGECSATTAGGGVYAYGTTTGTMVNGIVYGADDGVGVLVDASASWTQSYSDVYGNTDGNYSGVTDPTGRNGNISENPSFVAVTADGDPTNDNWHLNSTSACVDAGNSGAAYNDPDGTRNDMGAYGGPYGGW